jgi:hypothetical protein
VGLVLYRPLNFGSSVIGERLVAVSIAGAGVPIAVGAMVTAVLAIRWALLAVWPRRLGIDATAEQLAMRLGPFGTRVHRAAELDVRYLFEMDEDEDDRFERLLPEEEQMRRLLPQIRHADARESLDRVILRFAALSEDEAARLLGPAIAAWRQRGRRAGA